jgi:hypothetical protein
VEEGADAGSAPAPAAEVVVLPPSLLMDVPLSIVSVFLTRIGHPFGSMLYPVRIVRSEALTFLVARYTVLTRVNPVAAPPFRSGLPSAPDPNTMSPEETPVVAVIASLPSSACTAFSVAASPSEANVTGP